jgi:hypothetical protein
MLRLLPLLLFLASPASAETLECKVVGIVADEHALENESRKVVVVRDSG